MPIDRRRFFALGAATLPFVALSRASAAPAMSAMPIANLGLDAAEFGLRPGSPDDQSRIAQRAIDEAARRNHPLAFAPGTYRLGGLTLPSGAQLMGVRGATKFILGSGPSLIASQSTSYVTLSGIAFDGQNRISPQQRGMLHFENASQLRIVDCEIAGAGGNALHCIASSGEIVGNSFSAAGDAAIHSLDARGLLISRNRIASAGNNGIQIWRGQAGDDGSIVADNHIENIANRSGGSGQYGNAVNVFRAGNVIVRANRIARCAFSAVRGNGASNILIESNSVSNVGEVALYAEFGFEGAAIAGNIVDGAAIGIAVTNFNRGGRLATVQGNVIRNLLPRRPAGTDPNDDAGTGISVEADTAVTGNTIENAPSAGLMLGFGSYLRDVTATGNVVRRAAMGIGVSVTPGAGAVVIANNRIAGVTRGAVMGMDRKRVVTGDLMQSGAKAYRHITLAGNNVG